MGKYWQRYPHLRELDIKDSEHRGILDGKIYLTFKSDGANGSFFLYDGDGNPQLYICKRSGELNRNYAGKWDKAFEKPAQWLYNNIDLKKLRKGYIFYGEFGIPHTVRYKNIPPFLGFDVMYMTPEGHGEFIDWERGEKMFQELGVPTVPTIAVLHNPSIKTIEEEFKKHVSEKEYPFGASTIEGICIKQYGALNPFGRPLFAKLRTEQFKEEFKINFRTKEKTFDLAKWAADTYTTPARVKKGILVLIMNGESLSMSLMPKLFETVVRDILTEHSIDIYSQHPNEIMDFGVFRKCVAKLCVEPLKSFLKERSLENV